MKSRIRVVNPVDAPELTLASGRKILFEDHQAWVDAPTALEISANAYALRHLQVDPVAAFDPGSWTATRRQLQWDGGNSPAISLGYVTAKMIEALDAEGVEMFVTGNGAPVEMGPRVKAILERPAPYTTWAVRYSKLDLDWMLPVSHRIRYTMWEWDGLPRGWVDNINRYDKLLLVPSQQQAGLFRREGVTVPVAVVGHGVDPAHYGYRKPIPHPHFTFGTVGHISQRKGIDVLVRAFSDEFAREDDVRLVIKTSNPNLAELPPTTRKVELLTGFYSELQIAELLASFDVGVFPSRGEGFGLGGLETMGVGRTVICTGWGGMAEYLDPKYNYALEYEMGLPTMEWPPSFGVGYQPKWAEPSYKHLRRLLRHCYGNRAEVKAKGLAASRWVRRHWTWKRAARQLIAAVDGLGGGPPIARRRGRRA